MSEVRCAASRYVSKKWSLIFLLRNCHSNLIKNLGKNISHGRDCTMKSCMRLRSACKVRSHHDVLEGAFRFEAILPDYSFQIVSIRNLPLLLTPLSINLTKQNGAESRRTGHRMGYLTLNQTRKVVPLLESDTAVSLVPIVGVWVAIDEPCGSLPSRPHAFLDHPFVWGACVRFMNSANIADRLYIDTDTFLMANFGNKSVSYFEVSKVPSLKADAYACCDFSVDLTLDEKHAKSSSMEPIVCKFRAMSHLDRLRSFQEASGGSPRASSDLGSAVLSSEQIRAAARDYMESASACEAKAMVWSEGNTPLPRAVAPVQSAPSSPSKGVPAKGNEERDAEPAARVLAVDKVAALAASKGDEPVGTINGNAAVFAALNKNCGDAHVQHQLPSFPAELVLAQQMQLDSLRGQVAHLQDVVKALSAHVNMRDTPSLQTTTEDNSAEANCQSADSVGGEASKNKNRGDKEQADKVVLTREDDELVEVYDPAQDKVNSVMDVVEAAVSAELHANDASIEKLRSSFSRINPLSSTGSNHPVLRVHAEDEAELMEPSVLKEKAFGEAAFPGPTVDPALMKEKATDELVIDDADSDEETLKSLELLSEEMESGVGRNFVLSHTESAGSEGAELSPTPSMLETESILAIQEKYK